MNGEANPYSQGEGNTEEGQQTERLAGGAAFGKQQALEGKRPGGHRRHRRGHTQLDQERNEDEPGLIHPLTLRQFAGRLCLGPLLDMRRLRGSN